MSDTGAGGAGTTRESDSWVGLAHVAQLVRGVVWTHTLRLRQSASGTTTTLRRHFGSSSYFKSRFELRA